MLTIPVDTLRLLRVDGVPVMEAMDIIGWAAYGLMLAGLLRLGLAGRAPRGLERLDYRR